MKTRFASLWVLGALLLIGLPACAPSHRAGDDETGPSVDDDTSPLDDDNDTADDDDNDNDGSPPGENVELFGTWEFYEPDPPPFRTGCLIRHGVNNSWSEVARFHYTNLWSISGSAPNDVYVVGVVQQPSDPFWYALMSHFDGSDWTTRQDPTPATNLEAGFAAGPRLMYATASDAYLGPGQLMENWVIGRFNRLTWTEEARGGWLVGWTDLYGIWASAADEVFAVGTSEFGWLIVWNDRGRWRQEIDWNDLRLLLGVWGASANDVFAVGGYTDGMTAEDSLLLHYNGQEWAKMKSGNGLPYGLRAVMGSSGTDVYAVGGDMKQDGLGVVLHYDGETWEDTNAPVNSKVDSLWVAGPSSVYVPNGYDGILHYDGAEWTLYSAAEVHYIWGHVHSPGERR